MLSIVLNQLILIFALRRTLLGIVLNQFILIFVLNRIRLFNIADRIVFIIFRNIACIEIVQPLILFLFLIGLTGIVAFFTCDLKRTFVTGCFVFIRYFDISVTEVKIVIFSFEVNRKNTAFDLPGFFNSFLIAVLIGYFILNRDFILIVSNTIRFMNMYRSFGRFFFLVIIAIIVVCGKSREYCHADR